MSIKNALLELLNKLDEVGDNYQELSDTATREELHQAIIDHFVLASPGDDFPLSGSYAMFSDEGNEAVYKALGQFLNHAEVRAALTQLTPQERLDAFQDDDVESSNGSTCDDYFGWIEQLPPN
jgi:hypothetical protein